MSDRITPEQEEALGRAMAKLAYEEGHRTEAMKHMDKLPIARKSRKRDRLRIWFYQNPEEEISIADLAAKTEVGTDTARHCCWQFVSEGWLTHRQTSRGIVFKRFFKVVT